MNPFLNPLVLTSFLKNYLESTKRLQNPSLDAINRYRDKSFRKIVKYAYTVPLYHDKYKKAGIHPSDIKGIEDIKKLPMISKDDLRNYFPNGLAPVNYNKDKAELICTGGTGGKSAFIYSDFSIASISTINSIRAYRLLNFSDWSKSKIVYIGDMGGNRAMSVYQRVFLSNLTSILSFDNIINIDIGHPLPETMNELNKIQPDSIHSFPGVIEYLAYLKQKGYGKNINPKLLTCSGEILDERTRNHIEEAFGCPLYNEYTSIEANGGIAFECLKKNFHILYDLYEVEGIDRNGKLVGPGEKGSIVLTRLWGQGTPIIRYTGMKDWISFSEVEKCECGLHTPLLINGVEGRLRNDIILPNGKVFSAATFCEITPITQDFKTLKIKRYLIIQKKIDEIDILIVIDDELRDVGPSVDLLFDKIYQVYKEMTGPNVKINIKEVKEPELDKKAGFKRPTVISYVKPEDAYNLLD